MTDVVLVLSTVSDEAVADRIARSLIDERLAACVNVQSPMVSFYRWKGKTERDIERQLVIKTTRRRLGDLKQRLGELHPYELPEIVVVDVVEGSADYLEWVRRETE
jgi:periplasmic divalent cation tolerance protein